MHSILKWEARVSYHFFLQAYGLRGNLRSASIFSLITMIQGLWMVSTNFILKEPMDHSPLLLWLPLIFSCCCSLVCWLIRVCTQVLRSQPRKPLYWPGRRRPWRPEWWWQPSCLCVSSTGRYRDSQWWDLMSEALFILPSDDDWQHGQQLGQLLIALGAFLWARLSTLHTGSESSHKAVLSSPH